MSSKKASKFSGNSGSSDRGAHITSIQTPYGRIKKTTHYNAKGLREELDDALDTARKRCIDGHLERDKEKHRRLDNVEFSDLPDPSSPANAFDAAVPLDPGDLLDGSIPLDISHAGGELLAILHDEQDGEQPDYQKHQDWRTRRDRVQDRTEGFKRQMDGMVDAYLEWDVGLGSEGLGGANPPAVGQDGNGMRLRIVNVFSTHVLQTATADTSEGIPASLVRQGLIPCAPYRPTLAVTTRLLELFRCTHLRCPHLSIQAFVKGICDLHGFAFQPYLATQFSICYDLFVEIRANVQMRVAVVLKRDSPNWRLRNACPACTYKLEDEPALVFNMLVTMDGNDSLKCIIRKDLPEHSEEGNPIGGGASREVFDSREVHGDYYIDRAKVNRWARDPVMGMLHQEGIEPGTSDNPCASRWSNMSKEVTSRMWGVFDETGVFISLCRHGFVLTIADMVRSGEQAKYPLATVETLLDAFGTKVGGGYDIGCKFATTLGRSELGEQARKLQYTPLVGAFHGHAHNCLCQLSHLATYVEGMGLEDLEGCERFFSKSNALASSIRYSSVFHRKQRITEYIKHTDAFETSHNLSEFLVNNYKQALRIIELNGQRLKVAMNERNITSVKTFHQWLAQEKEYLLKLSKEPPEETFHIDYYLSLVKLSICEEKLKNLQAKFVPYQPPTQPSTGSLSQPGTQPRSQNSRHGAQLYHAHEELASTLARVHDLENTLGLTEQWVPGSEAWENAAALANHRRFRKCVDELESLVVSRIFELMKMNMSQTGYKLRRHILNALQQRSQAIRNAIERYNALVKQMKLSRPTLTWDQVINYAFLADFDVLRDCREDIKQKPWANPGSRALLDDYFKVIRAREEIVRLDIEIRRVVTYLHDEEQFLRLKEQQLSTEHPTLAHQIKRLCQERSRFTEIHTRRFRTLSSLPAFTGNLTLGCSIDQSRQVEVGLMDMDQQQSQGDSNPDEEEVRGEEEELELQDLEEHLQIITAVLSAQADGQ